MRVLSSLTRVSLLSFVLAGCGDDVERVIIPLDFAEETNLIGRITIRAQANGTYSTLSTSGPGESIIFSAGALLPGIGEPRSPSAPTGPAIASGVGSQVCIQGTYWGTQVGLDASDEFPVCFAKSQDGWVYLEGVGQARFFEADETVALGEDRTVSGCMSAIEGQDDLLREGCARDLPRLVSGDDRDRVVPLLLSALQDVQPGVRQGAALGLGRLDCDNSFADLLTAAKAEVQGLAQDIMAEALSRCAGLQWLGKLQFAGLDDDAAAQLFADGLTPRLEKELVAIVLEESGHERRLLTRLASESEPEREAAARMLFALDSQENSRQNLGGGALHYAALRGLTDLARDLIAKGVDLDQESFFDVKPVHYAAREGRTDIVVLLAEAGADVNSSTAFDTPLTYAIRNGDLEMTRQLLERGANPSARADEFFGGPLRKAREQRQDDIEELLEVYGAKDRRRQVHQDVVAELISNSPSSDELMTSIWKMTALDYLDLQPERKAAFLANLPTWPETLYDYAWRLQKGGNIVRAIAAYEAFLDRHPAHARAGGVEALLRGLQESHQLRRDLKGNLLGMRTLQDDVARLELSFDIADTLFDLSYLELGCAMLRTSDMLDLSDWDRVNASIRRNRQVSCDLAAE